MRYEINKKTIEFSWKNRKAITPGCTAGDVGADPENIASFADKNTALEELKKYKTEITHTHGYGSMSYYIVTEYYVEEAEYDEDGEWISGGDIWGFSEMDLSVISGS